jgi:GTP-binding protein EngB required for normal cell division
MARERPTDLNEPQQRRLATTCRHLDEVLSELEHSIQEARSESAFRRYAADLAPAEEQLFRAYVRRLRCQLLRILDEEGLSPQADPIGLRKSLLTGLIFFDIAVTELEPSYMTGYGELTPSAAAALNALTQELHGSIRELSALLSIVPQQTRPLPRAPREARDRFRTLEALVEKYGLVEFRTSLASVASSISRSGLEFAVFGRVNSGKSTLLNRLIGTELLTVGVRPVTSVPTRIRYGPSPRLRVTCAGESVKELEASDLIQYASEQFNPGNQKRVLHMVLEYPAPLLESGLTLVDTPGLGSIDASSTAETLAYLPYCDVAAVLVDAAATVADEDVQTVAALLRSGALVWVLLSRADLLADADRLSAVRYTSEVLKGQLHQSIEVSALSTTSAQLALFEEWYANRLKPLIAHQRSEHRRASARKTEALATRIAAVLEGILMAPTRSEEYTETQAAVAALQEGVKRLSEQERELLERAQAVASAAPDVGERALQLVQRGEEPRQALILAFQESAERAAKAVSTGLNGLIDELRNIRQGIARSIGWGLSDSVGLASSIRGLPTAALSASARSWPKVSAHAPGFVSRLVQSRLKHRVIDEVRAPLEDYAAVLRQWLLEQFQQIRADWESDARALRAELDRRLGYAPKVTVPSTEIEADLRTLGAPERETDEALISH